MNHIALYLKGKLKGKLSPKLGMLLQILLNPEYHGQQNIVFGGKIKIKWIKRMPLI